MEWTSVGIPGDDDRTGRRVHFIPQQVASARFLAVHAGTATAAPDNPPLTDRPAAG
ncbi:hypothetical protein FraEuI1c_6625 [Pseudofrankia inefficax]|uniref:Uncharacterized protein n=1 Tax=Pseudofrankia inefficax (strain DSM 45817 / CECT 9037 / DDB 130130 / EuI1c) TaxID=298654 RepID=E3J9U2_PSEI1|nr:hypothetical protein FraEuI1c_6625 [Pseudofrankia inefficax]